MLTDEEREKLVFWKASQSRRWWLGDMASPMADWMDLEFRKHVKYIYFENWCVNCGHDPHAGRCSTDGCKRC